MAEQNRKTDEQRRQRQRAEQVMDDYLDFVFAESDIRDIAREARHILGTYADHGELPQGSGFAGFCKLAGAVDRMRRISVTNAMIRAYAAVIRLRDSDTINAMCIDRLYRGRTRSVSIDPLNGVSVDVTYRTRDCANMLRLSEDAYRQRVSRGYRALESILAHGQKAAA